MVQGMGLSPKEPNKKKEDRKKIPKDVKNIKSNKRQHKKVAHKQVKLEKEPNKKPRRKIPKRIWVTFILIFVVAVIAIITGFILLNSQEDKKITDSYDESSISENVDDYSIQEERADEYDVPVEYISVLEEAEEIVLHDPYSKNELFKELINRKYPTETVSFAVDHIDVDWKQQALRSAERYIVETSPDVTREGMLEHLDEEGYTDDEVKFVDETISDIEVRDE